MMSPRFRRMTDAATALVTLALATAGVVKVSWVPPGDTTPACAIGAQVVGDVRRAVGLSERSLLVILRPGCRYCATSMPFDRTLAKIRSARAHSDVRLIAVLLASLGSADASTYVLEEELSVDDTIAVTDENQSQLAQL
jgi:hypothetical protein